MPEFPSPVHVSVTTRGGGIPLELLGTAVAVIGAGAFVLANLMIIAGVLAVTAAATAISVGMLRRHMVAGWAPAGTITPARRRPAIAPPVHVHFHGLSASEAAEILGGQIRHDALDELGRRALEAP
jgi:hypothetical protein